MPSAEHHVEGIEPGPTIGSQLMSRAMTKVISALILSPGKLVPSNCSKDRVGMMIFDQRTGKRFSEDLNSIK